MIDKDKNFIFCANIYIDLDTSALNKCLTYFSFIFEFYKNDFNTSVYLQKMN